MNKKQVRYFVEMYRLLEEHSNRHAWGNHGMINARTGHLELCSCGFGKPEDCNICGTTIRTINLLNKIDEDDSFKMHFNL